MDQVFFSLKRAHHSVLRFTRPMLAEFGLTPARFDLLTVLELDPTQSGVQRMLGLARATVSEMLARLEELGLVTRMRFRRTKMIFRTRKAEQLMQRAWDACLNSGYVPMTVDGVLTGFDPEIEPFVRRDRVESLCGRFRRAFHDFATAEIYAWHPDEYLDALEFFNPS